MRYPRSGGSWYFKLASKRYRESGWLIGAGATCLVRGATCRTLHN
jgi:hypothetical protein